MRMDIQDRLNKMENQQKLQLDGLSYIMNMKGDSKTKRELKNILGKPLIERQKDQQDQKLDELFKYQRLVDEYEMPIEKENKYKKIRYEDFPPKQNKSNSTDEEEYRRLKRNLTSGKYQLSVSDKSCISNRSCHYPNRINLPKISKHNSQKQLRNDVNPIREEQDYDL